MKIEVIHSGTEKSRLLQDFAGKHKLTFHSSAWLKNFDPTKITQCALLNNNNEVIGCFLYYRFKKFGFDFVISPPYTPSVELFYINPSESVVSKASFDKDAMNLIGDYFTAINVSYTGIYFPTQVVDTQPLIWKGFSSTVRYTYQIALSQPEETLFANLSPEKRKSVNKANKDGLEIKETSDYQKVEQLVLQSLSRNAVDTNVGIIKQILREFSKGGRCTAFLAEHEGKPYGAAVFIKDQDRAIYLFGGVDGENRHHGAGVSCMWQAILKAKSLGLKVFDFEGSMSPGIERYYREFGGKLTPYYKIEKAGWLVKTLMRLKGVKS